MSSQPSCAATIALAWVLLGSAVEAASATVCEQRALVQQLRSDLRSRDALAVLEGLVSETSNATDGAAIHLDRGEVLLDLWRVQDAEAEITTASEALAAGEAPGDASCGEQASEGPIRVVELRARAQRVKGDFAPAAEAWAIALARRRAQPPEDATLIRSICLAAEAFWLAGNLDEMERLYAEATRLAEELVPPDAMLLARTFLGAGWMASVRGETGRAEAAYARALELYRGARGDAHPTVAGVRISIGSLAADRDDLLTADSEYERARVILEAVSDPSVASDQAALALNRGSVDARLGLLDSARDHLETARQVWMDTRGPDHPHHAWVNEELANLLEEGGRLEEADAAQAEAVRLRERAMPGSAAAILTRARLAVLRARAGKAAEARAFWQRIDSASGRLTSAGGLFQANLAVRRAETAEALGDIAGAARSRSEVLDLLGRQLPERHPGLADARRHRARLAWLSGGRRQALLWAREALQLQRRVLTETIQTLPEGDALQYIERTRDLRDLLLCAVAAAPSGTLTPGIADDVMRELAASRALTAGTLYARRRLVPTSTPAEGDALTLARRRYAALLWQPAWSAPADYADELPRARRVLEDAERRYAREGASQASPVGPTTDPDAWKALEPRDALVAFGRYRCPANPALRKTDSAGTAGYVAFVRTAASPARIVRFPDGAALDRAVGEWYESIAGAVYAPPTEAQDEEAEARGRALAKALWAPLAPAIGSAERVFIVPDGALHSVSWYALPGVSRPYLIDEPRVLHVLTAESDLRAPLAPERSGQRAVVVLADPLVARASTAVADAALGAETRLLRSACRFVDPQRLPRLDEAVDEARDVQRQASAADHPVQLATGAAASESWLRDHAPGASILHLAAHGGLLSPESCREPTGAAEEPAAARVRTLWGEAVRARPLMRSGLLLTGAAGFTPLDAPGTNDDGVLVAEEAARLDLRGADWVVLSACSTRRGPVVDAEGSLGLHRAFHSAGARTVIASLWDVQDAPARRFMRALYAARLGEGRTTADAMRQAERSVLEELRRSGRSTHPVQWAAFVASGDWR